MIRILGGQFRSREVTTPKGSVTRPTSSQIRAAVFNMCQSCIEGARFLDICAGSGAMGLEAVSRGAVHAGFIEHNRYAIFAIKENIKRFNVENECILHFGDANAVLKGLSGPFDMCYFDPPYTHVKGPVSDLVVSVLTLLDQRPGLLSEGAYVFLEESSLASLKDTSFKHLVLESSRRYGSSQLFCFRYHNS